MTHKETSACFFAIGKEIYLWHPLLGEPHVVATRPDIVTSLSQCYGYSGNFTILDGCIDGKIRCDLTNRVLASFSLPVMGMMPFYKDHCAFNEKQKGQLFKDKDDALLVALEKQSSIYSFCNLQEEEIASVDHCQEHIQMAPAYNSFCWVSGWQSVYRGFGRKTVDGSYLATNIILAPYGSENFLVVHYHNESDHPQGITVSDRDQKILATWDWQDFGFAQGAGVYFLADRPHILILTSRSITIKDKYHSKSGNLVRIISIELRPPTGQTPTPRVIAEDVYEYYPWLDGTNPFLSIDVREAKRKLSISTLLKEEF